MAVPIFYPAIATWFAVALYMVLVWHTGRMRARHRIVAPAVAGHPEFERALRVQTNTLEQLVPFLPMLWLFAVLLDGEWAGGLGLLWVAARVHYAISYLRDPATRGPGMIVSVLVTFALMLGVAWGLLIFILF